MKVGKLSGDVLQRMVLSTIQFMRDDVLVHAGLGEDCAVLDFGDEVCLVTSDPITGASAGVGELAVHVSCNDLAANGGTPVGVQVVLLLPEETKEEQIRQIMEDIQVTAASLEVEVIGGHTEITSKVLEPVISITAIGRAPKDRYVTSRGARPGDQIVITKGVGIEATTILARDFGYLLPFAVSEAEIQSFIKQLSVVPEGLLAAEQGVHAMHDITEGGLLGAVRELCQASQVGAQIIAADVVVQPLTRAICDHFNLDPLSLLSSGSMLIATPSGDKLVAELIKAGIPAFIVGTIVEGEHPVLISETGKKQAITSHVEDELWKFFAKNKGMRKS